MKKGIEPVVTTILLLLIVIAIVGFAATFFTSIVGTAGEKTGSQLNATIGQISRIISIDSASGRSIIVRNQGPQAISTTSDLTLLVADAIPTGKWIGSTNVTIEAGTSQIFSLDTACTGSKVKATGPSNTAEKDCT